MMGAHATTSSQGTDILFFLAVNPEDYDTKITTRTDSCLNEVELVEDCVAASQWLIVNPYEIYITHNLEVERFPIPWIWDRGQGDYGSYVFSTGLFTVTDGRPSHDSRRDEPQRFSCGNILKLIPDEMDTILKTDGIFGGCTGFSDQEGNVYNHTGAEFYHPIHNRTYPGFSFEGLAAQEELFFPATDGETGHSYVQERLQKIMASADGISFADSQSRMNDVHIAGPLISEIFDHEDTDITYIVFLQKWNIVTAGWDTDNPSHCIGRAIEGFPSVIMLRYDYHSANFIRVTKGGVTCNCPNPS